MEFSYLYFQKYLSLVHNYIILKKGSCQIDTMADTEITKINKTFPSA